MAPEVHAKAEYSFQSDVFAFGMLLFDLMEQRRRLRDQSVECVSSHYKVRAMLLVLQSVRLHDACGGPV